MAVEIRQKLDEVLLDKESLLKSAAVTFEKFDADKNGSLDFDETSSLLRDVCSTLKLPPIDDATVTRLLNKYDDGDGVLSIDEFSRIYYDLLLRVRDKFYPSKALRIRRDFFVGRRTLKEEKISDLYQMIKKLGSGSFGVVHLVKEIETKKIRVCKTINKNLTAVPAEQVEDEIRILKALDHPKIIRIFEVYEDFNSIYIIMESCQGGELAEIILKSLKSKKILSEEFGKSIARQLLESLAYCHHNKVAHKDLKPENLMFLEKDDPTSLKVIDFGVAEVFHRLEDMSANAAGTALYMAPEVHKRRFGVKCDIWSAGVIIYLLLTGRLPFVGTTVEAVEAAVCKKNPRWDTECRHLSPLARDLLSLMLTKSPKSRPHAAELLQHLWFSQPSTETSSDLVIDINQNFQRFMKQSQIKNGLINLLTHHLDVSQAKLKLVVELFQSLDKDNDGMLSPDELKLGLEKFGWTVWDIMQLMQALDIDDSGQVQYTEFVSACYCWREAELDGLWTAFSKLDANHDGRVSREEFVALMLGGQSKLVSQDELDGIISQIDKNGDGVIDWDEFCSYMRD